jgi:hypothetical protein
MDGAEGHNILLHLYFNFCVLVRGVVQCSFSGLLIKKKKRFRRRNRQLTFRRAVHLCNLMKICINKPIEKYTSHVNLKEAKFIALENLMKIPQKYV